VRLRDKLKWFERTLQAPAVATPDTAEA